VAARRCRSRATLDFAQSVGETDAHPCPLDLLAGLAGPAGHVGAAHFHASRPEGSLSVTRPENVGISHLQYFSHYRPIGGAVQI
jgi:hypothetical protein